jgi:hypothetical protein
MERGDVWHEVFGNTPGSTAGLNRRFEQRVDLFLKEMA